MINKLPEKTQLDAACQKNVWSFGNDILYKLCKDNFYHKTDEQVLTKVLFIGRIYAAAVERRHNKSTDDTNDNFYLKTIGPAFKKSELDDKLSDLRLLEPGKLETIQDVLKAHYYLTNMLKEITELEKRSFSSKYLHFHLPDLFYIYDSIAVSALRHYISHVPSDLKHILKLENIDNEYATFYCKCFDLNRQIKEQFNIDLTTRQIDNLLIDVSKR